MEGQNDATPAIGPVTTELGTFPTEWNGQLDVEPNQYHWPGDQKSLIGPTILPPDLLFLFGGKVVLDIEKRSDALGRLVL